MGVGKLDNLQPILSQSYITLPYYIYIICTTHIEYNTNIRTPMANIDYPTRLGHQKAIQVDQYGINPIILSKLFKKEIKIQSSKVHIFPQ